MLKSILFWGAIAALIIAIPTYGLSGQMLQQPPADYGMVIGYLTMLVALSTIFVAIKQHRDRDLGGVIGFWPAFGLGIGISIVAGIGYVVAWEAALAVTGMDFATQYGSFIVEQARARGASPTEIARLQTEMAQFARDYARPLYRIPMTFSEIFPVGVLVSAIGAGLLRNSRFLPARAV